MNAGERIVVARALQVRVVGAIDVDLGNSRAVGTDKGFFGLEFSWLNYIKISRWLIECVAGQIVDEQYDHRADRPVWKKIGERQRGFAVVWPLAVGIFDDRESGHWSGSAADHKEETGSECRLHVRRSPFASHCILFLIG
jgi:hypothetical protein